MLVDDSRRLEQIDRLYELGLHKYVSLPVLVVVGDQSSGKSSVLEGLTRLPLPRDSGLCTRFPTQVVFKRSAEKKIEVSIIPCNTPDEQQKIKLEDFAKFDTKGLADFESQSYLALLSQASECMGVPKPGHSRDSKQESFSNDILKIEMSGPEYEHFSVIDLPGLFRNPTAGQTTKEDIEVVREMVWGHLQNPRSIALVVVPANVDIGTQEIVQMAKDADPESQRTLGVFTKPDLVDKGAEDKVISLISKSEEGTSLGYMVVCNRSQKNRRVSIEERNDNELAYLKLSPWNEVSAQRAGISALKDRLNEIMVSNTRQNFEDVGVEINEKVVGKHEELKKIGQPRATPAEQRAYLLHIASELQSLGAKAIDAYYGRDECFRNNDNLRLASLVMASHEAFSSVMHANGSIREFREDPEEDSEKLPEEAPEITPEIDFEEAFDSHEGTSVKSDQDLSVDNMGDLTLSQEDRSSSSTNFPELDRLFGSLNKEAEPIQNLEPIMEWIKKTHRRFKGFEIGATNPSLLPSLFIEQSSSWHYHAIKHVQNVILHVHLFLHDLLDHVCRDPTVRDRIWGKLKDPLLKAYSKALDHATFLVEVERGGNPITLNHYFADNLKKTRESKLEKKLRALQKWKTQGDKPEPLIRTLDALNIYTSNSDQMVEDLHDTLKSYHKVARKRFVDAVCKQAIDHFLICARDGPLAIFSPGLVGAFTDAELAQLAGERPASVRRRLELREEIRVLEAGKRVLEDG